MNIKNLVKSINIEASAASVVAGSGTFKNILDRVYDRTMCPLINNNGDILGFSYNTGLDNIQDNIEKEKFKRAYIGKPVMYWFEKCLELSYSKPIIAKVIEDGDDIRVIANDGEEIIISKPYKQPEFETYTYKEPLPDTVMIELDDIQDISFSTVRNYLRRKYGYCLARGIQPDININNDIVEVTNIEWGRKLTQAELDAIDY